MRTFCPDCQVTFRITPEQLKARAGRVRCGQCQSVFNALDSLLDESSPVPAPRVSAPGTATDSVLVQHFDQTPDMGAGLPPEPSALAPEALVPPDSEEHAVVAGTFIPVDEEPEPSLEPYFSEHGNDPPIDRRDSPDKSDPTISEEDLLELGKTTGLILPRATTAIPGYSKWAESAVSSNIELPVEGGARWPFFLAALLFALALAGQVIFHFRSELAVAAPAMRPLLLLFSQALGADLPPTRHVELVSIEASDLQTDPARNNLLVLTSTLRNRAPYAQAFPSLELSLTDIADTAIVRRVLTPQDYLFPQTLAEQPFAANSEATVRLWIEARDVGAAGYRLYVFYP